MRKKPVAKKKTSKKPAAKKATPKKAPAKPAARPAPAKPPIAAVYQPQAIEGIGPKPFRYPPA